MAVRQYVGARYVPKFYEFNNGVWQENTEYEPLTIVQYNGNSYTSKKSVPANIGNPQANPEYWAATGNYNAQIEAYRHEVVELSSSVDNVSHSVDNIEEILEANNITTPNYAVWIGDSYTQANSLGDDIAKRFASVVSNELGVIEKNYAFGGTGYTTGSRPYLTQVENAISDFNENSINKDLVKYVFVCGCRNDGEVGLRTSYQNAVTEVFSLIKTNFTKAKIVIIPVLWDFTFMPSGLLFNSEIIMQSAEITLDNPLIIDKGYTWLTGRADLIMYQGGANVHPNVYGHKVIANHILSVINGEGYQMCSDYIVPSNVTTLHSNVSNFRCQITRNNDKVRLQAAFDVVGAIGNENVFVITIPNIYFNEFYLGDQRIWCDGYQTRGGSDLDTNFNKLFILGATTRTDETAGSYTITCRKYNGNFATGANKPIIVDVEVPLGVLNSKLNIE